MPRRSPRKDGRPPESAGDSAPDDQAGQRLQKVLASSGLGSRRQCEELILTGRVEVDGEVVLELGTRVLPGRQQIRVDGIALKKPRVVHYLLNKPMGVLTTNNDPSGRERVIDMVPQDHDHIFPVGRLDMSSEGLIIITNDGELANLLTHPRYGVEKTYQVLVAGQVTFDEMERLKKGVFLAEGFAKVVRLTVKSQSKRGTLMEIVLDEGRNREIRRLLARVGHKVLKLKRIAIGDLKLADLATGEYRNMRPDELRSLRASALASRRRPKSTRQAPAKSIKTGKKPTKNAVVNAAAKAQTEKPESDKAENAEAEAAVRLDVDQRFRMTAAAAAKRPQRRTILGVQAKPDADDQPIQERPPKDRPPKDRTNQERPAKDRPPKDRQAKERPAKSASRTPAGGGSTARKTGTGNSRTAGPRHGAARPVAGQPASEGGKVRRKPKTLRKKGRRP